MLFEKYLIWTEPVQCFFHSHETLSSTANMKARLPIIAYSALTFTATPVVGLPPAGSVKLTSITYGGTGCQQGALGFALSDEASTMTRSLTTILSLSVPGQPK